MRLNDCVVCDKMRFHELKRSTGLETRVYMTHKILRRVVGQRGDVMRLLDLRLFS